MKNCNVIYIIFYVSCYNVNVNYNLYNDIDDVLI